MLWSYYYRICLGSRFSLRRMHLAHKMLYAFLKQRYDMLYLRSAMYNQLDTICSEVRILAIILGTILLHLCQVTYVRKAHFRLSIPLLHVWEYLYSKNSSICGFILGTARLGC